MDPIQLSHFKHIQEAYLTDRLVIFVGAGVSANSGVPTWSELITEMKKDLPESVSNETDDLKVAQLYKDSRGYKEYLDCVKTVLKHNKVIPNPIHKAIFDLNPVHIITTNYDDLLEQEIANEYKQYDIIREDADLPKMSYPNAVIKMHGDFVKDNIVLCETDYFNYAKDFPLIRAFVQSIFSHKLVIFIGFSFADLNLKMIINEIQNILGEDMQRAYLISLRKPDPLTSNYFEKKHINIVHLSQADIDSIIDNNCIEISEKEEIKSLNIYGQNLYKYLKIIQLGDLNNSPNPILNIWSKLRPYIEEIRTYGRGLKYFIPQNLGIVAWDESSFGVQTHNKYFKDLNIQLKTFKGLFKFIKEIGEGNISNLLKLALYNHLYYIDDIQLISQKTFNKYLSNEIYSPMDYFRYFDFKSLILRMKDLSKVNPTGKIEDLELGYIYYKLGDYYKAYLEFNNVLPIAWTKGKYILYFICLYNIYRLRGAIRSQLLFHKTIDGDSIYEKLCRINLSETLSKLQLPIAFRKIFQDLLADRYLNEHLVMSEELKESLHQQREASERGASGYNHYVDKLVSIYDREENFSTENFILSDFSKAYIALSRNTVIGILNSHAIKDKNAKSLWGNSKLESLDKNIIFKLIFSLSFNELEKIFKQYQITEITINQEGAEYLSMCIENFDAESYHNIWNSKLCENLLNLFFILSFVKVKQINIDKLYSLISWVYNIPVIVINMGKFLDSIISNNPPSPEIAHTLLNEILSSNEVDRYLNKSIISLIKILEENNKYIDNIDIFKDKIISEDILINLPYVISENKKKDFYNYALPILKKSFVHYIIFLDLNQILPNNIEEFKNLIYSNTNDFELNYGTIGFIISKWRKIEYYRNLWTLIDNISNDLPYIKFALDPINYSDPSKVKVEWILAMKNDEIKKIINNPIYNSKLLEFITFGQLSVEDRKRLFSLYNDTSS